MLNLVFLVAIQIAYQLVVEKNNLTALAMVIINTAVIAAALTPDGNSRVIAVALIVSLLLVKGTEKFQGVRNAQSNANFTGAGREPTGTEAR